MALLNAILDPVKLQVGGYGVALLDIPVGNTSSGGFVRVDSSVWLVVYHSMEGGLESGTLLGVEEDPTNFSFSCQAHYVIDDSGDGVDGNVVMWRRLVNSLGDTWSCMVT